MCNVGIDRREYNIFNLFQLIKYGCVIIIRIGTQLRTSGAFLWSRKLLVYKVKYVINYI